MVSKSVAGTLPKFSLVWAAATKSATVSPPALLLSRERKEARALPGKLEKAEATRATTPLSTGPPPAEDLLVEVPFVLLLPEDPPLLAPSTFPGREGEKEEVEDCDPKIDT